MTSPGHTLPYEVRRGIQREMRILVKKHGSQAAAGEALDGVSQNAVGKAQNRADVGPGVYEKLLKYLGMEDEEFRRKHANFFEEDVDEVLPVSRRPHLQSEVRESADASRGPATNNLAIALSEYEWDPRLSPKHRGQIARQSIAARERRDIDPPVDVWTKIIMRLEALMLELAEDFAKLEAGGGAPSRGALNSERGAAEEEAPSRVVKTERGAAKPAERKRRARGESTD